MQSSFPLEPATPVAGVLTVAQLVRDVRDTLEHRYPLMWIRGELSNLSRAGSGHCYFTLKDANAQVDCVMFRTRFAALDWQPRDGAQVEVRALVTLYEPRGRFQLTVEFMRRAGVGALHERFLQLKEKLEREGLFDAALKRPLPRHPRAIGVLTSLEAAALRDVLTTLARRNPAIPVIVYRCPVQGEGAGARIAAALARAAARAECDVLLLVRGGGSLEDLWAFNEETVARAIRACSIAVVVGVGHETDFTIADFAADRRAPTPTAAAELAAPAREALLARIDELARCLAREARRRILYAMQEVDSLARRLVHPAERLRRTLQHVEHLRARLAFAATRRADTLAARVGRLATMLAALDPRAVLARGYSITVRTDGAVVRDAREVREGERLRTTLAHGTIESEVKKPGDI
jgi:exodeoxyribonuclease VII large subunit